jgi:O-antigen/teichoic acid export membrane protein
MRMQTGVGFSLLGAAFNQGSTLLVNIVVANLLGRDAFGRYTMVLATLATLAALGQLSMGYTATKHVAEFRSVDPARASRILGLCTMVSLTSAAIAGLALFVSAGWLARTILESADLAPMLRLAAVAVFFTVLNGFFTGALAGLERYSALARVGIVSGTLYGVLCILLARAFGLNGAVTGVAMSGLVQAVVLGVVLVREAAHQGMTLTGEGFWQERAILSTFAVPASLGALISLPALWIASALLARQPEGYHQLALFGAANSFRTMVLFVPQAVNTVGMSMLNNQRHSSAEGYKHVFWMNAAWTMVSALGAAGVLYLAASPLLGLFGPSFLAGRSVLAIMLGAAIIEAVAIAMYQVVVSRGSIWASLFFVSVPRDASIVLLAALLAPALGAAGLATAYAAGWALSLAGILALVSRLGVNAAPPVSVPAR